MRIRELFRQYIWLVKTIYKARRITLEEINNEWVRTEMSGGVEMARSTFNRHRDAIEDMFGIYIECDRSHGNKYYIGNPDVLQEDSIQNWMLSTLSVNSLLNESVSLKDRILLEHVPSTEMNLDTVIEAMKKNHRLEIMYQKYSAFEPKRLTIDPYCVKMYKRRWYILGHFRNGNFGMFSLDRIKQMTVMDEVFEMPEDFSCEEYFSECFGIVQGDGSKAQRIVVRAYDSEQYNLRDLPLHHSQREIGKGEDYTDFELFMRPTLDFNAYVLSRTQLLKVISPEWYVDEFLCMLEDTISMYQEAR